MSLCIMLIASACGADISSERNQPSTAIVEDQGRNDNAAESDLIDNISQAPVSDASAYTVEFWDWNGTVLSKQTVPEGELVVIPQDPTRSDTETVDYEFAGWDGIEFLSGGVYEDFVVWAAYHSTWTRPWDGTVASSFAGGDGSSETPYLIESPEQLAYLAKVVNDGSIYADKHFSLQNSMDMGSLSWTPIGYDSGSGATAFQGAFIGNGHTISNLKISSFINNDTGIRGIGLFGYTDSASVSGINLKNVSIDIQTGVGSKYYVGPLIGYADKSTQISSCSCESIINFDYGANSLSCGGMVGLLYVDGSILFSEAISTMTVTSEDRRDTCYVGGLIGESSGVTIEECTATCDADIAVGGIDAGGLIGRDYASEVVGCTATLRIDADIRFPRSYGDTRIGGFIGSDTHSRFSYCQATEVAINGSTNNTCGVGGFGESLGGTMIQCFSTGQIQFSASIPPGEYFADLNEGSIGGFAGILGGDVADSYCNVDMDISGVRAGGFCGSSAGSMLNCYSAGDIKSNAPAAGFSFEAVGDSTVNSCFSVTNIDCQGEVIGAFFVQSGYATRVTFNNCYRYDGQVLLLNGAPATGIVSGTLCYAEQLNDPDFYRHTLGWSEGAWDYSEVNIEAGRLPVLK